MQIIPFPSGGARFAPYGSRIYAHVGVLNELQELLKKEDEQIVFAAKFKDFSRKLLDNLGIEHLRYSAIFEVLRGASLRSMKFRILKLGNLRILYCIEGCCVYLLKAFKEKKTGTDYQSAIKTAEARRKEIEGGIS